MAQIPDIKPEVNKDREEKKKGGLLGLFSRLGGRGGASGAGAGAGTGAAGGGAGGLASGSGLLATKAGLIALALAGTTVAGGGALLGWRFYGPGSEAGGGSALQLFASKPRAEDPAYQRAGAPSADGTSASLQNLASANRVALEGGGAPAPTDAAPAAAAASAGGASGPINGAPEAGPVPHPSLQNVKKLGELSKAFGESGKVSVGGGAGGASASAGSGGAASAAARSGQAGAFSRASAGGAGAGRSLARARSGSSSSRQLANVLRDHRTGYSSPQVGRQYDGGMAQGSAGPEGGMPGLGGGAGDSPATTTPNTAPQTKELEAPPTPQGKNVTPWQKAINTAAMLVGLATALLMVAKMMSRGGITKWVAIALGGVIAAIGMAVTAIGGMVAGGKYGQTLQGGLLAAAGAGLMLAGGKILMDSFGATAGADGNINLNDTFGGGEGQDGFMGGMSWPIILGGGLALVGLAGALLTQPKSYNVEVFDGRRVPDL